MGGSWLVSDLGGSVGGAVDVEEAVEEVVVVDGGFVSGIFVVFLLGVWLTDVFLLF